VPVGNSVLVGLDAFGTGDATKAERRFVASKKRRKKGKKR
jgi:hypothetical protein